MEISFENNRLEKIVNDSKKLEKEFGSLMAKVIRVRLDDLSAATALEDVRRLPGKYHELTSDRKGQFATNLIQPNRLVFIPNHDPIPKNEGGGMDWKKITKITILEITNYHGK